MAACGSGNVIALSGDNLQKSALHSTPSLLSFKSRISCSRVISFERKSKARSGRPWLPLKAEAGEGESEREREGSGGQALASKQAQLMEQNKRLLDMQRELLDQIEERKKLHSALVKSIEAPLDGSSSRREAPQRSQGSAPGTSYPPPAASPFSSPTKGGSTTTPLPSPPFNPNISASSWKPPQSRASPLTDNRSTSKSPSASTSSSSSTTTYDTASASARPLFSDVVSSRPSSLTTLPLPASSPAPNAEKKLEVVGGKKDGKGEGEVEVGESSPPVEEAEEPLAGPNVMNVVLVASECAPWSKTGGLGDVVGALPKALARRGHRVMVVAPRYSNYEEAWDTTVRRTFNVTGQDLEVGYFHGYIDGVDFVFVDHTCYHHAAASIYGGSREDVQFRMILLCKAAVEAPWHVPCGGVPYGDANLVFVANDWHTALLPVYLQAYYRDIGLMQYTRSILIIHNMAHQGRGPLVEFGRLGLPAHYADKFKLHDPVGGEHMNIFMAGIVTAHRIVAVSHGYAWECQTQDGGWGLDGVMRDHSSKLRGVVNGIDTKEWSPETDVFLRTDGYANYSVDQLEKKALCKAALQKELGLPVRPEVPLIGFIGRLDYQKGVDIIGDAMPWMMEQDLQLVLLGSGRADLENMLRSFEGNHRDKCRSWVGFSVQTAHRITAGADILLMPSRFEPCGLNQLYAMRYGTVPVVHSVGGLRDTVTAFDPFSNTGLGWTFDRAEAGGLMHALGNAMWTYKDYKESWAEIQRRGMAQDLSWDNAAQQYEEVLLAAKYTW